MADDSWFDEAAKTNMSWLHIGNSLSPVLPNNGGATSVLDMMKRMQQQEEAQARMRKRGGIGAGARSSPVISWDAVDVGARVSKELPKEKPKPKGVTWDDVKGLEEAKSQLQEFIEGPYKNAELYKFYKKTPPKGVLLFGPPGCGKTMLVKAAVTALAGVHGKNETDSGFIHAKTSELLDMYVGQTEKKIQALFQSARDHKAAHGYPAIIFLDEADAMLGKRTGKPHYYVSQVNAFLAEMDGLDDCAAIVILATNRSDSLDSAVVRDGRIDCKIRIPRPSREAALQILHAAFNKVPVAEKTKSGDLIELAANEIFSAERIFYEIETVQEKKLLLFSDLVNGAMIANVVANATSIAMSRDMLNSTLTGISAEDVMAAIDRIVEANRHLDHKDDLAVFTEGFETEVVAVSKYKKEDQFEAEVA